MINGKYLIGCFAVGGIVALQTVAMATGNDGNSMTMSVGAIGAIVATTLGVNLIQKKKPE